MAVDIITETSILLNHSDDFQEPFIFEQSSRELFAYIPSKFVQKENPDFSVIWDAQKIESFGGNKTSSCANAAWTGPPPSMRIGVLVTFKGNLPINQLSIRPIYLN